VDHDQFTDHFRIALGQIASVATNPMVVRGAVALAAVVGALLGWLLGRLTRRLFPLLPRIFFGATLAPALCTLVYAFVLLRVAPSVVHAVPFMASALGAMAYGVCVALVPPIRRRPTRRRS
jgi:hypothetical protein